jgi:hypothetical protein
MAPIFLEATMMQVVSYCHSSRAFCASLKHPIDYIKATYPLTYTLFSVCWGANVFGAGYDNAEQTAYLDQMLRWGLDWLIKAHPQPNELYVQVGNSTCNPRG